MEQDHRVFQQGEEKDAEQRACDGAASAAQGRAAEDDRDQNVKFPAVERFRHDFLDDVYLHHARDRRADAEPAVGEQMHFPAADAGAPCAFRVGAVAVELAAKAGVFQDVPGDERHRQHHRHRQVEHGGVVQFAKGDAVADPVGQAVDAFAVFGEVDEQAEEEVKGGDGDNDGDDAEAVYQHGIEDAERRAAQAGERHAAQPAAAAVFHQHADGDVLHDRRGDSKGDVDAADDEDDDEASRKNHLHRVLVEQVEEILPAEKARRGKGEAGGEQEDE